MNKPATKTCSLWLAVSALSLCLSVTRAHAESRRVALHVLLVSDGEVGTTMIKAGLDEALVPYTELSLRDPDRPRIDEVFLVDTRASGVREARFQAVILPNNAPAGLQPGEYQVLTRYEREFRVRQLDAYVYPSPAVGLKYPDAPHSGSLDGMIAQLTSAARSAGFSYLRGSVPFEDLDPAVCESYGYLSKPMTGAGFTPFLTHTGSSGEQMVLLGVYENQGREEMVLSAAMNQHQLAQQLLFPGLLTWLTYGVHLGIERNYLAVHIDDVFISDARWLQDHDCTYGAVNCKPEHPATDILMNPDDVEFLLGWQRRHNLKLDMVFNGYGYDGTQDASNSRLGASLIAHKDELRWISHTYSHKYLGCLQDESVFPWRCARDAQGKVVWNAYELLHAELSDNLRFAREYDIDLDPTELVTGEHSGLRRTPMEPADNPSLPEVLDELGIRWIGSDSSREMWQRPVGRALTVPRYPLNIFYNTGSEAEEVDLYNWIYTPSEQGGSGLCHSAPMSSCIAPLDLATAFRAYIVPQQSRSVLLHALSNSPRPHYAHQSNLAEDRILYPVLDAMLAQYHRLFTADVPLDNASLSELGRELERRAAWLREHPEVRAYLENGALVLQAPAAMRVPITVPTTNVEGARYPYGSLRTGWQLVGSAKTRFALPVSVRNAQ